MFEETMARLLFAVMVLSHVLSTLFFLAIQQELKKLNRHRRSFEDHQGFDPVVTMEFPMHKANAEKVMQNLDKLMAIDKVTKKRGHPRKELTKTR